MALLCTVQHEELKREITELKEKQMKIISEGIELESYRKHGLYGEKKDALIEKCKKAGIPFKYKKKHELVKVLTKERVEEYKPKSIEDITTSLNEINKLPVTDLRCILKENGLPTIGTKDELALRVYLKKANKDNFISRTEVDHLLKIVGCAEDVIRAEKRLSLLGFQDSIERRKFTTNARKSTLKKLQPSTAIEEIFKPLTTFLRSFKDSRRIENQSDETTDARNELNPANSYESYFQVGTKVKVYWSKEEVKPLGWRGGWYVAFVTDICRDEDQVSVQFVSEPDSVYQIEVTTSIKENTLTLC